MPRPKVKRPQKLTQTTLRDILDSSSSPTKSVSESLPPKRTTRSVTKQPRPQFPDPNGSEDDTNISVGAIRFEKDVIDASDDEQPHLSPMKKRRMRRASLDSLELSPVATKAQAGSDNELDSEVHWKGKRKGSQNVVMDSDDSGRHNKRRLVKGVRPPSPEDEDDILDDENQILENRMRNRNRKTVFQKNLARLRKKKQGHEVLGSSESENTEEEDEDEDEEDGCNPTPFLGAKPDGDAEEQVFDNNVKTSEDDSFIVDDGDDIVAVLPAMFSMNTHQDLVHHFKVICQFFVHLAVSPTRKRRKLMESVLRENEYFSLPLQIARRKLSGIRDSLVASSIWRPAFKKALETYPHLDITVMNFAVASCDACNLGGRISTRIGRLHGSAYNALGFNPLKSGVTSLRQSNEGDNASVEFYLGRFCAKRTRAFHQFTHWEYDLFTSLNREVDELRSSGGHEFVRVAFTEGIKPQKVENADEIMDWLDQRRIIDMEWVKIKDMMESAHHLEIASKKGEED